MMPGLAVSLTLKMIERCEDEAMATGEISNDLTSFISGLLLGNKHSSVGMVFTVYKDWTEGTGNDLAIAAFYFWVKLLQNKVLILGL